ncbi:hypothetical protein J7J12_02125 [bacterium]|nr:hypothetical protein [bacterium]
MFKRLKQSIIKSATTFGNILPILIGVLLLVSFVIIVTPSNFFLNIFTNNPFVDPFLGAISGSILIGNPILSYILGGEFIERGISEVAVISFMISWVTVGIAQLPMESLVLGKKFAIIRNAVSFLLSIIISILIYLTLGLF